MHLQQKSPQLQQQLYPNVFAKMAHQKILVPVLVQVDFSVNLVTLIINWQASIPLKTFVFTLQPQLQQPPQLQQLLPPRLQFHRVIVKMEHPHQWEVVQ